MLKVLKKIGAGIGMGLGGCLMVMIQSLTVIVFFYIIAYGVIQVTEQDKYGPRWSLHGYEDKEYYTSGGFGDFVDYGEYRFKEKKMKKFESSKYYTLVTDGDIEHIRTYFSDFEGWLHTVDYADEYSFDADAQINAGDYFYIYNEYDNQPYWNYDVYYVDMESCTVYYIHANI